MQLASANRASFILTHYYVRRHVVSRHVGKRNSEFFLRQANEFSVAAARERICSQTVTLKIDLSKLVVCNIFLAVGWLV